MLGGDVEELPELFRRADEIFKGAGVVVVIPMPSCTFEGARPFGAAIHRRPL